MHQKYDMLLMNLLKKIRVGNIDQSCKDILTSWFIEGKDPKYSFYALHIFAKNALGQRYNSFILNNIQNKSFSMPTKDKIQKSCLISVV